MSRVVGTLRYKDPSVVENGWSKFSDVYALMLSYLEVATGIHPFAENGGLPCMEALAVLPSSLSGVSAKTKAKLAQILKHEVDLASIPDYAAWFGLSDTIDAEIPVAQKVKWSIRDGYMLKTLLAMVADDQPRARTVVVSNTLKANKIVGNKASRGSINASISTLKKTGIVEEFGKKVRLSTGFRADWSTQGAG